MAEELPMGSRVFGGNTDSRREKISKAEYATLLRSEILVNIEVSNSKYCQIPLTLWVLFYIPHTM